MWQAKRAGFDYNFEEGLSGVSADARRENLRKMQIDNQVALDRNVREGVANATSVAEAAQRTLNLIEQNKSYALDREKTTAETARIYRDIKNMIKDGRIKDFEIMLNQANVSKSDPLWARMVADFLSGKSSFLTPLESIPKGSKFRHKPND